VDDIGWWVDSKDDEAVAAKLSKAAAASIDWAASNGAAFGHGKAEAANLSQDEDPSHHSGERWHKHRSIQQGSEHVSLESG